MQDAALFSNENNVQTRNLRLTRTRPNSSVWPMLSFFKARSQPDASRSFPPCCLIEPSGVGKNESCAYHRAYMLDGHLHWLYLPPPHESIPETSSTPLPKPTNYWPLSPLLAAQYLLAEAIGSVPFRGSHPLYFCCSVCCDGTYPHDGKVRLCARKNDLIQWGIYLGSASFLFLQ